MHILEFGKSFSRCFFDCHAHCWRCLNLKHRVLYSVSCIPFVSVEAGEDRLREYKKLQDACLRVKIRSTTGDSYIKIRAKCRLESRTNWRMVETVGAFVKGTLNILARTPAVSSADEIRFSLADRVFDIRSRGRESSVCAHAIRELECLTHMCLVSVFLDYSILSGSLFAPAFSLCKMKKFLRNSSLHKLFLSRVIKSIHFIAIRFFFLIKKRRSKIKLSIRQWNHLYFIFIFYVIKLDATIWYWFFSCIPQIVNAEISKGCWSSTKGLI